MSSKAQIEQAVKDILERDEHPLETAYNAEVAFYSQTLLEIKLLHERNLYNLLDTFKKRGLKNTKVARDIAERIATL